MIYIGQFNKKQVLRGEDKALVAQKTKETGFKYTKTALVEKGGKIVGLKVWLLTDEEYFNSKKI